MRTKKFRIKKIDIADIYKDNPYLLRYKLEQRFTILPFVYFWGSPFFAPPHLFATIDDLLISLDERANEYGFKYELNEAL